MKEILTTLEALNDRTEQRLQRVALICATAQLRRAAHVLNANGATATADGCAEAARLAQKAAERE